VPKIQEMLSEHFGGRQLCRAINPDEAVAYGAAVQGAILAGVRHPLCDKIVLVDVTPLSLGVEISSAKTGATGLMSVILPRNTKIPCKKTRQYTTEKDYESHVDVRVFEGERKDTKDNHLLGEFRVSDIEIAKKNEPEIEVTFALDTNGILHVTAKDKKTKAKSQITISDACKGLSQDEIERMVQEAQSCDKADTIKWEEMEMSSEMDVQASPSNIDDNGKFGNPTLSALEPHSNSIKYFLPCLFVLAFLPIVAIGHKRHYSSRKPQEPLMHTHCGV